MLYREGMDKTSKPFVAGAAVLDSHGRYGIVTGQRWHRDYGWRVHYYVPGPILYRALATDLRPCPYCAPDEACAYHTS